jgi:hypothetical protein
MNVLKCLAIGFLINLTIVNFCNATEWYVIENYENKCIADEGPSKLIKMLQTLKQPYEAIDTTENGKIVKVRIEAPTQGFAVNYYNGKERCLQEKKFSESKNKEILEKYK